MHAVLSFSPLFYHLCVFFSFFFFFFSISSTPAVLCILKPPMPAKKRGIAWCAEPEGWHRASWMAIHTLIISFPREEGGGGKGRVPHHLVSTTPTRTRRASSALVHCVMSRAPPLLLVAYVESVSPQSLPRVWKAEKKRKKTSFCTFFLFFPSSFPLCYGFASAGSSTSLPPCIFTSTLLDTSLLAGTSMQMYHQRGRQTRVWLDFLI